jgi:hypothetical protein
MFQLMGLANIKREANGLKLEQLRDLDAWLHGLIRKTEAADRRGASRREVVQEETAGNKTYRLEGVRCGKQGCRCFDGYLHGPYWYAYWSENGRTRSRYVGKRLPDGGSRGRS